MKPSLQQKAELVRRINAIEPYQRLNPDSAVMEIQNIRFYPQGTLIKSVLGPNDILWYVSLPQETVPLDGSIANIHYLNHMTRLNLTPDALPDYLKFRLYFGKDGGQRRWATNIAVKDGLTASAHIDETLESYHALYRISTRGETETLEKKPETARLTPLTIPAFYF